MDGKFGEEVVKRLKKKATEKKGTRAKTPTKAAEVEPRRLSRREVGVQVLSGRVFPQACLIYEETWSDGTTRIAYGQALGTNPTWSKDLGAPKSLQRAFRPEYQAALDAIARLLIDVQAYCRFLDTDP